MQRAGAAAAAEIALRFRDRLNSGVLILAGPGNNGGDAWVVAAALATAGVRVRVIEPIASKTADAQAERATALELLARVGALVEGASTSLDRGESLVVDGLLGTGSHGAPRNGGQRRRQAGAPDGDVLELSAVAPPGWVRGGVDITA